MQRATLCATALSIALSAFVAPARADDATLRKELDALRAQVAALQAEVDQMRSAPAAPVVAAQPVSSSTPVSPPLKTVAEERGPAPAARGIGTDSTRFWGYGELNYNHTTGAPSTSQADLRRAVLGFSHAFDADTHVYGELEWEHAVVSQTDQGESEVEQLYVEHRFNPELAFRAGLTLIPLGLLNEHHEPTSYYGVERNLVETAIIPSTWREGGVSLLGSTESGFSWNVGVTTSQNLRNWDPVDPEGRISPLGAIHQELQLASASDLAVYGAANWQGIPGLTLGGGVFSGDIGQGSDDDFAGADARATLGEVHARWQSGPFDLSALYARGTISDTDKLNLTFVGNPYPVPKSFWGSYAQGAWRVWEKGDSSLAPFVRYEAFNTAASFASVLLGLGVPAADTERVWTVGVNYYLTPEVVFKADYQHFNLTDELLGYGSRFNLGVGYQF
jgi:hypothetical protein